MNENQFKTVHNHISTFHIRQFARGYVAAIRENLKSYSLNDEFDEWDAYCNLIDLNFYMHRGLLTVTAYRVSPDGEVQTDTNETIYVEKFNLKD